ncbi:MAG: oligopeptide transporter, OPT family [Thermoplasmata archaeon]|nr:MAG: oligopeptide transporter, OPT family [Thermoplasmata archaeon]
MAAKDFVPYIPAEKIIPEFTAKMVIVGVILTIVMAAANAYLGLYAGMTVSATIPAVVMALAFLKPLKGTILEINLAKAMAVTGEALAAGVIFTFPALYVLDYLTDGASGWSNLMDHLPEMMIGALIGGVLGIIFTIPLRKVMIIDLALPYPEGVASAEVMKAMERGGKGINLIVFSLMIGALFKLGSSGYGFRLWEERLEGVAGKGSVRGYGALSLSPALLGVGYILGPNIAWLVFSGGIIGWMILIPMIGLFGGWPESGYYIDDPNGPMLGQFVGGIHQIWFDHTMYVGVGAIVVGGIYTLIKLRKPIMDGVRGVMKSGGKKGDVGYVEPIRTERDFPLHMVYFVFIGIGMFALYWWVTNLWHVALVSMIVLFIFCFFFTAVAGYLAGVIGSSNNPVSGVTVATLLFTAILLAWVLRVPENLGMTATIIVGAVVCVSAAIAGDSMQELKTGQLIGATPFYIQISRFIGVLIAAIMVPIVVGALAQAYGIAIPDPDHPTPLAAPQAMVMASISRGIFRLDINFGMLLLGVLIAFILIYLKKPVMAIAIGIYLPLALTVPIMIGGLIKMAVDGFVSRKVHRYGASPANMEMIEMDSEGKKVDVKPEEKQKVIDHLKEKVNSNGILFASGLVAGEAIMGVIIAVIVIARIDLTFFGMPAAWPGLLVFMYLGFLIMYMLLREFVDDMSTGEVKEVVKDEAKMGIKGFFDFLQPWKRK